MKKEVRGLEKSFQREQLFSVRREEGVSVNI